MDRRTYQYYQRNAATLFERYFSGKGRLAEYFAVAFSQTGVILLDYGCGSGRDVKKLMDAGFQVWGYEPNAEFIRMAERKFPELAGRLFSDMKFMPEKKFDGIFSSAVLQHVPDAELNQIAFSFKYLLRDKGRVLLAFPVEMDGIDKSSRDENGRLFVLRNHAQVEEVFYKAGFGKVKQWQVTDKKNSSEVWAAMLFEIR